MFLLNFQQLICTHMSLASDAWYVRLLQRIEKLYAGVSKTKINKVVKLKVACLDFTRRCAIYQF